MQLGLWIPIASVPVFAGLYAVSRSDPDAPPFLTRLINRYTESTEKYADRNALHTSMIEQAGADRVLFTKSTPQDHVQMKFPECVPRVPVLSAHLTVTRIMNQGSPYNVPAGQVNSMEKVIDKFKRDAYEDNERKLQALRDDNIKSEQPRERFSDPAGPGPSNQRWPAKGVASV